MMLPNWYEDDGCLYYLRWTLTDDHYMICMKIQGTHWMPMPGPYWNEAISAVPSYFTILGLVT